MLEADTPKKIELLRDEFIPVAEQLVECLKHFAVNSLSYTQLALMVNIDEKLIQKWSQYKDMCKRIIISYFSISKHEASLRSIESVGSERPIEAQKADRDTEEGR